jgi:tripartite-type tricarboxylate transporter receptor subunit TctC
MRNLLIASVFAVARTTIGTGQAQVYPSRPITMVVPLPAGSAFDVTARLLAERMQVSLGQPVIVENVTGASGSIGTGRVARAVPDGYTLCFGGVGTHVINGAVLALPYDVLKDFEPVSLIATAQMLIVAKKAMAPNDLKGLIAWLKANPGKAVQGTGGPGSLTHVAGISFQKETGTRFGSVPYRGAGAAINDLVAGHIDIMIDLAPNSLPHVRTRTIRPMQSRPRRASRRRPPSRRWTRPDCRGSTCLPGRQFGHRGGRRWPTSPRSTLRLLIALADPTVGSRLAELGQDSFPREQQTPEALGALQKAEIEKWWPIIKAANIKAE